MSANRGEQRFGAILLLGVSLGWGFNWMMMKITVAEVPVWQFRAVTGVLGAIALLVLARLTGQSLRVPRHQWLAIAVAGLFNITSWFILIAYAVKLMASGHAAILSFTMPLWAMLIGVTLLGEKLTLRRVVALGLGLVGVVVLLSHDFTAIGSSPLGALIGIVAAINWAIGVQIQKHVKWEVETLALAGWQIAIGIAPVVVVALFLEDFVYYKASWPVLAAAVYLVFVAFVFCYYAWFTVVRIFPASVAAIGTLLVPVIAAAAGSIFLAEPFGWREAVALVTIVGGVALVLLVPDRPAAAAKPTAASTGDPATASER
jgi:drug/metabolite transporter (DMT)-like permease